MRCAALSFDCTLLSSGRASFGIGNFFGPAFGGATIGYSAVSFGYAAFSFCYAVPLIGFGEGHCAPSTVRAANQASRSSTSKWRMPCRLTCRGAMPRRQ